MADLSFINENHQDIGTAIDELLAARQQQRGYMGLSQIGIVNECPRKAWCMMHGYIGEDFPGRILRLFRSGDDCEFNMVTDLKDIGLKVWGEQKEVRVDDNGKSFVGHIDGLISGLDAFGLGKKTCLLEIKSCNQKRFNELVKCGDYCTWGGAAYKAQVHIYATLLKLDRIFVAVENKNTSERFFQRFDRDLEHAVETMRKAFEVMNMEKPPTGSCPRRDWYKANFCSYRRECFG